MRALSNRPAHVALSAQSATETPHQRAMREGLICIVCSVNNIEINQLLFVSKARNYRDVVLSVNSQFELFYFYSMD